MTQQICDKGILENDGTLKLCNKAVDNYRYALESVPECYKTQEMCDKELTDVFLYLILFLINIKLKKSVTELFLKILFFLIVHCSDKYKTQTICDESADDSLSELKPIPNWFDTSKTI